MPRITLTRLVKFKIYVNQNQQPIVFPPIQNPGGVHLGILGRGVPPGTPNPDPISDQSIPFSTPVFRPGL